MLNLRTQNRIIMFLSLFSFYIAVFFFSLMLFKSKNIWSVSGCAEKLFFGINFSILSVFSILFYSFSASIFIHFRFAKTECFELIFFAVFLFALLFEGFRLAFLAFDLWKAQFFAAELITRVVIFSKLLTSLSLFCCVIAPHFDYGTRALKSVFILIALSFCFAAILPVNTLRVLPTFENALSSFLFPVLWIFITGLSTFILFFFERNRKIPLYFCLLSLGYILLCISVNPFTFSFGTVFLFVGTFLYLNALHFKYLW